jgi:hypothetical protein
MRKTFGDYTLLAGSAAKGSLWAGPDHLLYIEAAGIFLPFKEHYRRIDFKNIHSLTYGRTHTGLWITVILAFLLAGMVVGFVRNLNELPQLAVFFAVIGVPLLIILGVHLAKGPTCVCKLQTAVQVLRLKPLDRLRRTEACVARLNALCIQHQGGEPAVLDAILAQPAATGHVGRAGAIAKSPFPGSRLVLWGLVTMLLGSAACLADLFIQSIAFYTISSLLPLFGGVLVLTGLARAMMRYRVPGVLLTALWGEVITVAISIAVAYGLFIYVTVKNLATGSSNRNSFDSVTMMLDVMNHLSNVTFQSEPVVAWIEVSLAGLAAFFALLGLPAALRPSGGRLAVPPPAPMPIPPAPRDPS